MHTSFSCNPHAHQRVSGIFQQQSGFQQPIYNLGTPPNPGFMSHHSNLLVNHPTITRSFASVVSCENHMGMRQTVTNKFPVINNNQNSGIFSSLFQHFHKPTMPQTYQQQVNPHINKEFEDFKHMPCLGQTNLPVYNPQTQHFYQHSQQSHININKLNVNSDSACTAKTTINNAAAPTKGFIASLFGGSPQEGAQMRQRNPRWFYKGFRCRGGGRWKNPNNKFRHDDVNSNTKNVHEKERSSIERNIHDDACDFVDVMEDKEMMEQMLNSGNKTMDTKLSSCQQPAADNPPFLICSMKDFPAIVPIKEPSLKDKKETSPAKNLKEGKSEGFVVVPTEASISTPSFTPKRLSLCEKFIKSPTKLFPTSPFMLKPCLKPSRRSISECSDDFIVFADDNDGVQQNEKILSDNAEYETDSEDDDDDVDVEVEDEESSEEEESEDESSEDEESSCEDGEDVIDNADRVDSGFEEKKVSSSAFRFYRSFV